MQIGQYRNYASADNPEDCLVWAKGQGNPVPFKCGLLGDDSDHYFKIHTWNNDTQYVIADCGTSGSYDPANCNVMDSTQPVFDQAIGAVANEAYYGCDLHIFGSSGDQQNVGLPAAHVQGLVGNTWAARSFGSAGNPDCPPYVQSEQNGGDTFKFYDTRNAS